MQHSQVATKLIEHFEGCRLTAYQDQGGVWTIGWGHTGPEVVEGLVWTQEQADSVLNEDIGHFDLALQCALGVPLTQNQWDALTCFIYNIGAGHFETSTVRKRLLIQDYAGAADAILMWNKVAGQVNQGLVNRRAAERALFLTPPGINSAPTQPTATVS